MTKCIDGTDGVRFAFDHAGTLTANMDNDTWSLNEATPQMATPTGRVLADIAGTEPATGTARYYYHDNIDSTRRIRAANKTSLGQYEFDPYGLTYASTGAQSPYRWGPYRQDPSNSMYYTPYRWYIPMQARWLTRDPLGMVDGPNLYTYVIGDPTVYVDPLGTEGECCQYVQIRMGERVRLVKKPPFAPFPLYESCSVSEWQDCTFKCMITCPAMGMTTSTVSCGNYLIWALGPFLAKYCTLCECVCCPYNIA